VTVRRAPILVEVSSVNVIPVTEEMALRALVILVYCYSTLLLDEVLS